MARVLLLDLHHGHAVAAAFGRQIEVRDFAELLLQQRHEHFIQRQAQHGRFVRRFAGIRGVVDRVAAHGDAVDGKHGETVLLIIVARVVAIRPFQRVFIAARMVFIRVDMAFEHDFGRGGHAQLAADGFYQFRAAAAQEAGELVFGQTVRHRRDGP